MVDLWDERGACEGGGEERVGEVDGADFEGWGAEISCKVEQDAGICEGRDRGEGCAQGCGVISTGMNILASRAARFNQKWTAGISVLELLQRLRSWRSLALEASAFLWHPLSISVWNVQRMQP